GQPIEHLTHALSAPNPAAVAVRPSLTEPLVWIIGIEAHDLEQQAAVFVDVGIPGDDGLTTTGRLWWWRWVGHDAHGVGLAAGFEERAPAQFLGRSALGIGDELERGAAALGLVVVPNFLADVETTRAVGVGAVPA